MPGRANRGGSAPGGAFGWRDDTNEVRVANEHRAGYLSNAALIDRHERAAIPIGADNAAMQHARPDHVRSVLVTAGDEIATVDLLQRRSATLPGARRCRGCFGRHHPRELLASSELTIADGATV